MADGIRINDASLEMSPAGLEALLKKEGASVTVTGLDVSVSPEALNTLLAGFTPEGQPAPSVVVSEGRLQVTGQGAGGTVNLDVRAGAFRLEITDQGLRLVKVEAVP